ncbi:hypothetical protein EV421DRAFT_2016682 [Armillaria borealis]|uniref:F-box domain-containing protein n=1 Tax=Armillaria borealis TaxID=47425 RepID=A0AA39JXN2_9AGAR|nr:hypothetical protein EV421DRAFT_1927838 [Armillaria borealis]KAK0448498.1 hypothetical protein EV421DRAFT_2016682 [Armillaria borealis]
MAFVPWSPCTGCPCKNHHLPSYDYSPDRYILKNASLTRLTRSNDPPLDAEVDSLQAMIASYEAELQSIQSEEAHLKAFILDMEHQVSAIQKTVDALPQERERISEAIQERKRLLSPMRRLPPEILSRVFRWTIQFPMSRYQNGQSAYWWRFVPEENILCSIERVCKRWREACLSSPELWSYINIIINDVNFGDNAHAYIRRLGRQLSRSGGSSALLSLAISHDASQSSPSDSTQMPPTLMALLFSLAGRIQELHLALPSRMFEGIPSLQLSLPSLKTLGLIPTDGEAIDDHQSLQLFSSTPNLRTLDIVDVKRLCHSFVLPWSQITTFRSDHALHPACSPGALPRHYLYALKQLSELEECHLRLEANSVSESSWDECSFPITCPKLRILKLSSWRHNTDMPITKLADRLVLPALMQLEVECSVGDAGRDPRQTFTAIRELLQRSKAPITVLHFDHGRILTADILHVLQNTPTLEDICLTDIDEGAVADQVLFDLTLKPDKLALVPRLRTLHLSGALPLHMHTFRDMLKSRWTVADICSPPVRRLAEVKLCRFISAADEQRLAPIIRSSANSLRIDSNQGLEVTLESSLALMYMNINLYT